MPSLKEFSIGFPSTQGPTYFSGQIIQGSITVDLAEPMKMRGIRAHIIGMANVHWSESHSTGSGKNRRRTTRHYRASESYIKHIIVLYGKAPDVGGDNPVHPAGRVVYPFQFQIPPTAPSSFEGGIGSVRYAITGVIDRPWKFDHTTKVAITVVNLLDLNREPHLLTGIQGENSKTMCCLCCESGPVTAVFKLNRQCYVPGEHVPCFAEVNNTANKKMDSTSVKLVQQIVFKACTKTRTVPRIIATVSKGVVPEGGTEIWNGETIHIPAVPPSRLQGCNIIDINYYLMFVVDPSGFSFDLIIPLDIVIGSIPHVSMVQQYTQQAAPPNYNVEAYEQLDPSAPPPVAFPQGIPPPSYSEAVGGKVNIREEGESEHTRGNMEYAPIYPYYDWGRANNPDGLTVQGYTGEAQNQNDN